MHDRLSVHAVCFPGAGFRELAGYWRELGAQRVSLSSYLLLEEGPPAAQEALRASQCTVESITHPFLPAAVEDEDPILPAAQRPANPGTRHRGARVVVHHRLGDVVEALQR